jgi:hypothetical protein
MIRCGPRGLSVVGAVVTLVPVHPAAAGPDDGQDGYRLEVTPVALCLKAQPGADSGGRTPDVIAPEPIKPRYGDKGTEWISFGIAGANDFSSSHDYNIHAAWSRFLVDEVEVSAELAAWYFDQNGPNAFGINPNVVFRWHLYRGENWTFYHDAGIGVLLASDTVPDRGTNFDFTPRLGVGVTYGVDEDTRLQFGFRWHHISNARIQGDASNPARDAPLLYFSLVRRF